MAGDTPYHHGHLRQALIDAGLESLERSGLQELSLRAIAESLGVSKAAPYRHFRTKEDLLTALAAEGYQLFADWLEGHEAELRSLTPDERLKQMYRLYGEFALGRPELYRLMFSRLGNSLHSERCRLNAQRAFSVLRRIAETVVSEGQDIRQVILSLYAAAHGWAMILMDDLIPPEVGVDQDNWLDFASFPRMQSDQGTQGIGSAQR